MESTPKRRIYELDLLRGFFICVIILDHLQFWPSPFQYLTGQGRLWVSAAEGFFLISGLLIGYLRAYKGAKIPLRDISVGLLKRAAMLYVWCVAITLVVVSLIAILPNSQLFPKLPMAEQVTTLPIYLWNTLTSTYASDWIYFLRLYAIMLATTPIVLWLIRKGKWWVVPIISLSIYAISLLLGLKEASLQWQVLFFGAALIGWKFEAILAYWRSRPKLRKGVLYGLIAVTLSTMALSYFMVHGWGLVEAPGARLTRESYISIRGYVDPLFSNNPLVPLRIGLAFLWFSGLLALFHVLRAHLLRYLGWLLLPFGQASLSVYCLQAIVLCFVVVSVPISSDFWYNGILSALIILLFAGLMRIKIISRLLPR